MHQSLTPLGVVVQFAAPDHLGASGAVSSDEPDHVARQPVTHAVGRRELVQRHRHERLTAFDALDGDRAIPLAAVASHHCVAMRPPAGGGEDEREQGETKGFHRRARSKPLAAARQSGPWLGPVDRTLAPG